MSLSINLRSTAQRLLATYGESVTATRRTAGSFNPATGSSAGDTTTSWTLNAHPKSFDDAAIDGVNIRAGDISLILESDTYVPETGDKIAHNSVDYKVVRVENIRAQGINVIFEVQLRR